jgi:hypothetical protein
MATTYAVVDGGRIAAHFAFELAVPPEVEMTDAGIAILLNWVKGIYNRCLAHMLA